MKTKIHCGNCQKPFNPKRTDAKFCSDRCAAQWARDNGYERERFHAEKPEWIKKNCEFCNTIFEYNEYAMRSGERVPKFCSNKCRQGAYRERKAAAGQPAGKTHHWDDARNDKTETKGTSQGNKTGKKQPEPETWEQEQQYDWRKGTSQPPKEDKGTSQKQANKGTSQPPMDSRWKSKDVYVILGVTYLTSVNEIKKAWKKLLRTYHPDVSKDPNAAEICKKINWAWDRVENPDTRANRR